MADEQEGGSKGLTAPYTAFSSIKTAAKNMKEHGLPGRIDRSVLTNFNGSVASQVMQAFKFLGLTTSDGVPTPALQALVKADEETWAAALEPVVKAAYAPMFTLNLDTASPSQFVQQFRKAYPGAENVSRKSLTFFVNALQEAKIPVSAYILKNKKPRIAATNPKKRTVSDSSGGVSKRQEQQRVATPASSASAYDVLMKEIYDPNDMKAGSDEEKAVFVLARYLKMREILS